MKQNLSQSSSHYGGVVELYHAITHSQQLYEFAFLDSAGKILYYARIGKDPDAQDVICIQALIKELAKARGGNVFTCLNISAIRFRLYPNSLPGDTAFEIGAPSLALEMLDEHEGTCLIRIMVGCADEQVIVDRLPSSSESTPDKCTRKLLYLALVLKCRAGLSQLLYTVESCWDTDTEKTQKHYGDFLQ